MIDIHAKFNSIVEALTKAGLYADFKKEFTNFKEATIETKIQCGLSLLKKKGIVESIHEGDWGLTFESKPPIKKNNGAGDNGNGQLTEEHANSDMPEGTRKLMEALNIPLPKVSAEYTNLSEAQRKEFDFARLIGISEADAFRVVRITHGFNGPRTR